MLCSRGCRPPPHTQTRRGAKGRSARHIAQRAGRCQAGRCRKSARICAAGIDAGDLWTYNRSYHAVIVHRTGGEEVGPQGRMCRGEETGAAVSRDCSPAAGEPTVRALAGVPEQGASAGPGGPPQGMGGPGGVLGQRGMRAALVQAAGTRCWSGSRRTPSGSSAARSTPATTAATATSRPASATRRPSSGRASRATRACSPTGSCTARSTSSPTPSSRWASQRATASRIYLPMIPEAVVAMLACARIGAIHSVVFGGFSAEALRDRINDAQAQGADHGRRRLAARADHPAQARRRLRPARDARPSSTWSSSQRGNFPLRVKEGRDHWYHRLIQDAKPYCPPSRVRQRGPALHPLHLRHDRQAQGHRPHHRRLPDRHLHDDQAWSSTCGTTTSSGARPTSAG